MKLPNPKELIKTYDNKLELTTKDIMTLFSCSMASAIRLKNKAVEQMKKDGRRPIVAHNVETQSAFEAWGVDMARVRRLAE